MEGIDERELDLPGLDMDAVVEAIKDMSGTTELAVFINEVWAKEIEKQAQAYRIMRGLQPQVVVNTDLLDKPGDIVHIAKLNDLLPASELTETVAITPQAMGGSDVPLTPTEYGTAVQISRKAQRRTYIPTMQEAAEALGNAIAQKEDLEILDAAIDGASQFVFPDPAYASIDEIVAEDVLTASILTRARALLRTEKSPAPYAIVIHTDVEGELLQDDQFIDVSKYGDRQPVLTGEIGTWLGMKVLSTQNIPTAENVGGITVYKNLILGARSLALALKANPDFQELYQPLARATDVVSVMEFQAKALNADRYAVVYCA